VAGKGGMSTRFGGVGASRVRRNSAVFYAAEIAAAKTLLFLRKSVAVDIFTLRDPCAARGSFVSIPAQRCHSYHVTPGSPYGIAHCWMGINAIATALQSLGIGRTIP